MEDDLHRKLSASLSLPTGGPLSGWPQAFIRQLVLTIRPLLVIVRWHGLPISRSISRELPVVVVTQPRNTGHSIRVPVPIVALMASTIFAMPTDLKGIRHLKIPGRVSGIFLRSIYFEKERHLASLCIQQRTIDQDDAIVSEVVSFEAWKMIYIENYPLPSVFPLAAHYPAGLKLLFASSSLLSARPPHCPSAWAAYKPVYQP